MSLISMLVGEIDTLYISPVKVFWQLRLWDFGGRWVFLELLGFFPSLGKVFMMFEDFSELFLFGIN